MKKRAAFVAFIMLIVCAIAFAACNNKEKNNVRLDEPENEPIHSVIEKPETQPPTPTQPERIDTSVRGNTVGNCVNLGIAAQQGDWIYYAFKGDKAYLYKIRTDGTEKTKLTENDSAFYCINVVSDWIYYNDGFHIYKIRTDGTDTTMLNEVVGVGFFVSVVDDWIYYDCFDQEESRFMLFKMRIDGTDVTKITDEKFFIANIVDDWIYYNNADPKSKDDIFRLYKIRTDGTDKTRISDTKMSQFNIVDNWIYYRGEDGIYKSRLDGSENMQIISCDLGIFAGMMNVDDSWIYYKNNSDNNYLYKMRTDGTDITKLCEDNYEYICVVGDWIYYNFFDEDEDEYNLITYKIRTDGTGREKVN